MGVLYSRCLTALVWVFGLIAVCAVSTTQPAKEEQPRLDRFGDPLPDGAIYRVGSTRFRAGWGVHFLAFSKDGKTLLSINSMSLSHQYVARIWKVATGEQLRHFPLARRNSTYQGVALSPDGSLLAVLPDGWGSSPEEPIALVDVATGRVVRSFAKQKHGHGIAFSADGKLLATADEKDTILLWDPTSGKAVGQLRGSESACQFLVFSPDGNLLASAHKGGVVRLWDSTNRRELRRFQAIETYDPRVDAVTFSPDGKILAMQWGRRIELWNTATGKRSWQSLDGEPFGALAFSPNGKLLAGTNLVGYPCLWDTTSGEMIHRMEYSQRPECLAFSPDGALLASGDENIHLWRVATGEEVCPGGAENVEITSAAFTPDGRLLATGGPDEFIRLWDANTGAYVRRFEGHGIRTAFLGFSPDGNSLLKLTYRDEYSVWDTVRGKELRRIQAPRPAFYTTLSPSGRLLAWASHDHTIQVRDVASGKELRSWRMENDHVSIYQLHFSPGEKLLAAIVMTNEGLRSELFELPAGKRCPAYRDEWQFAGFSPDDQIAVRTDKEGRIHFQEAATAKDRACSRLADVLHPAGGIRASAFSPDGRTFAAVVGYGPIRLWETATGKERHRLAGYMGWMEQLAFAPDGGKLVSVSTDKNALVWRVLGPAPGQRPVELSVLELRNLWDDLASEDGRVAFRAVRTLTAAGPARVVDFLRRQERNNPGLDRPRVARWIAELESDEFAVRDKAATELAKLGPRAEEQVRKALQDHPTLEARKRLELLLDKLKDQPMPPALVRGWRAVEVLEHLATPAARKLLEEWAKEVPQAKAALERLNQHPPVQR